LKNKKVLVVDNENSVRNILREFFSYARYSVFTAKSAEEALNILEKENIRVMFLEIVLPDMNGIDLCRKIRGNNHICVIHAFTDAFYGLVECRAAGFDDFFVKPTEIKLLLKATYEIQIIERDGSKRKPASVPIRLEGKKIMEKK
jgi:DNA-binding response OmpR family regulator